MTRLPASGCLVAIVLPFLLAHPAPGAAGVFAPVDGTDQPVIEVRGTRPYADRRGKPVAVDPAKVIFYPHSDSFDATVAPHWVVASGVRARSDKTGFIDAPGHEVNFEFSFSVNLESPVALDRVWIVLVIHSTNAGSGLFMEEVGSLRPFRLRTVTVRRRLDFDLGEGTYEWYLFSRDIELLHSLMPAGGMAQELSARVWRARVHTENADAAPYLTYPPKLKRDARHAVKLRLQIAPSGAVQEVTVAGDDRSDAASALAGAARQWWFLPRYVKRHAAPARVEVSVDLTKADQWSNDLVQVAPVADPTPAPGGAGCSPGF